MLHQVWKHQSPPPVKHKFSLTSRHEPEPYFRTTATNADHDATAETPTAASTTSRADENDDDPNDEHEYVNTENIKIHIYDIDKQYSKQLSNATNATTKLLSKVRFRKKQKQITKKTRYKHSI